MLRAALNVDDHYLPLFCGNGCKNFRPATTETGKCQLNGKKCLI